MSGAPSARAGRGEAPSAAVCLPNPSVSRRLSCSWSRLKSFSVQSSGAEEGIPFLLELFGARRRLGQFVPELVADQLADVREIVLHLASLEAELLPQRAVGGLLPLRAEVVRFEDAKLDVLAVGQQGGPHAVHGAGDHRAA